MATPNVQKPNDQKSNAKNPNNPAKKSATDNRATQKNPTNQAQKPKR
jgi:hypothetical protein